MYQHVCTQGSRPNYDYHNESDLNERTHNHVDYR